MTSIKMYPALNGDSFLITHNSDHQTSILIDGGYAKTFQSNVIPDLKQIAESGEQLDLVVATHIDHDHISGLLHFFKNNGTCDESKIVQVGRVWHNSLRSLAALHEKPLETGDLELLEAIRHEGYFQPNETGHAENEISSSQGSSLASLLIAGKYKWNEGQGLESIDSSQLEDFKLNSDVNITILGPNGNRLEQLRDWWIHELRQLGVTGKITNTDLFRDAYEFLCSHENRHFSLQQSEIAYVLNQDSELADVYKPDSSYTNASSISLLINAGSKFLLFLGDSWAEDIVSTLNNNTQLEYPIQFDAIKVSHHGSFRNTSPELLSIIDSPKYFISSNGDRHNHPDIEVLKAIVDRTSDYTRELFFNYSTAASHCLKNYKSKSGSKFIVHDGNFNTVEVG